MAVNFSNIASLTSQRRLGESTRAVAKSSQRLASGMRINSAGDDAAGLAVSSALHVNARVFNQALRNVNDGISMLQIAEGALSELSAIVTRQKELATQAANGVYELKQRAALHEEANALVKEFNRIVATTEFNGVSLLQASGKSITLATGNTGADILSFGLNTEFGRPIGTGDYSTQNAFSSPSAGGFVTGDLNGDGMLDLVTAPFSGTNLTVHLGNGDGTLAGPVTYAVGDADFNYSTHVRLADFDGNGSLDIALATGDDDRISVLLNQGNGTFSPRTSYSATTVGTMVGMAVGDVNGDNIVDMIGASTGGQYSVHIGNGDGTFRARINHSGGSGVGNIELADFNNDGIKDILYAGVNGKILQGNGDGTFRPLEVTFTNASSYQALGIDVNNDGKLDVVTADYGAASTFSVYLGNGDGTFGARSSYHTVNAWDADAADINQDGYLDLVIGGFTSNNFGVSFGNGDGSFRAVATVASVANVQIALGDFNGDDVTDIVTGGATGGIVWSATTEESTFAPHLNLMTQSDARSVLAGLDKTLNRIGAELGSIGANQSRLDTAARNLLSMAENSRAAASRISDADVAEEAALLLKNSILQQIGSAILAQANLNPNLAFEILSGVRRGR